MRLLTKPGHPQSPRVVIEISSRLIHEGGLTFNQPLQNPAVSYRKLDVGENACASPVHPSLSSRCGQSVGTLMKFPFTARGVR